MTIVLIIFCLALMGAVLILVTKYFKQSSEISRNSDKKKLLIKTADDFILKNQDLISLLEEKNEEIRHEQVKNEQLLLNILPSTIVKELKQTDTVEAKLFANSTVLFTDFKGFTELSERLSPSDLIEELNICFSEFDRIVGRHTVEKIKTIGDAYMAVSGVPTPNENHAKKAILAAFEIQQFMIERASMKKAQNEPFLELRIGLHSGPVIAGVVGLSKFQYDIWGDTVNVASRMESSGEVNQINISHATYMLLKEEKEISFVSRGEVNVKGKGTMSMYFANA